MEMRGLQIKKRKNTQKAKRKEREWDFLSTNWVSKADICLKGGQHTREVFGGGGKTFSLIS